MATKAQVKAAMKKGGKMPPASAKPRGMPADMAKMQEKVSKRSASKGC